MRRGDVTSAAPRGEVTVFGCFELRMEGQLRELAPREQRLVAFLALRGRRTRSFVAGILWPETTETRALASLRTAVMRARKVAPGLLHVGRTTLALAPDVRVDVDEALRCVGDSLHAPRAEIFTVLTTLASADLLPGWYDDWVLFERERLGHIRIRALESLAEQALATGQHDLAVLASLEAIAIEPLRESAHAIAIRAYLLGGNHAQAVGTYESYRRRLAEELGVTPSAQLHRLLRPAVDRRVAALRRAPVTSHQRAGDP